MPRIFLDNSYVLPIVERLDSDLLKDSSLGVTITVVINVYGNWIKILEESVYNLLHIGAFRKGFNPYVLGQNKDKQ